MKAAVLSAPGATSDLAHLTDKGHRLMAETIWSLVGKSMDTPGKKDQYLPDPNEPNNRPR